MLKTIEFLLGKQNNTDQDAPPEEVAALRAWEKDGKTSFSAQVDFMDPDEELPDSLIRRLRNDENQSGLKMGAYLDEESGRNLETELKPESGQVPGSDPGRLVVTDHPRIYRKLKAAGIPAAVYSHRGNRGESFSGAEYLIEEPARVDEDSWEKIYERLHGLPWTILETPRCIVREFVPEDLEDLYSLYDEQARRFILPPDEDREREQEILNAYIGWVYSFYGYGYWAVIQKETGQLIGRFGYAVLSEGSVQAQTGAEVSFGYLLAKETRGRGLATEVCKALLNYGFEMLGFQKIVAEADADNAVSEALLKRLGFTWAGAYRQEEEGPTLGDRMDLFLLENNL